MNAAALPELTAPFRGPRSSESGENCESWGRSDSQVTSRRCRWRPAWPGAWFCAPEVPGPPPLRPRSRAQRTGAPARREAPVLPVTRSPASPHPPQVPRLPCKGPSAPPAEGGDVPGKRGGGVAEGAAQLSHPGGRRHLAFHTPAAANPRVPRPGPRPLSRHVPAGRGVAGQVRMRGVEAGIAGPAAQAQWSFPRGLVWWLLAA